MSVGSQAAESVLAAFSGDVGTVHVTFARKTASAVRTDGTPIFPPTDETAEVNAFVLPPSEGQHMGIWGKGLEPGTLSASEYAFLWVAASGMAFAPKAQDDVTIGEENWRVLGCDPYALSGVAMAYAVGVRKQ